MFKKMIFLAFFVFSLTAFIHAQSFQLGFRIEPTIVKTQYENDIRPYKAGAGIMLDAGLFPVKWIGIEGRAGIVPSIVFYNGFETSLLLKYSYELNHDKLNSVFLTGGYIFHHTSGEDHAGGSAEPMTIDMPAIGIGATLSRFLNVEVLYAFPRNKAVGRYDPSGLKYSPNDTKEVVRIKNVLKLGIGLSWDIFSWKY